MIAQPIYRTGARSATTARQLNAARSVASPVLRQTITLDQVDEIKAQIPDYVDAYLIACELVAERYYLVMHDVPVDR